ncbi:sterigmatocystin biosynthesis P450 monooxygenase StcS [Calycina marina]|uniref:Sterigmatocystin biosynthesis P450 monooxygenase StcS n=1 Tax=Calycina marina TaxID=1763456 RepID=A0A9P7YXR7_9HELO|nr:sterigmatocystin biosynthesis P450 monooxygenase StcS [Calycina marina]
MYSPESITTSILITGALGVAAVVGYALQNLYYARIRVAKLRRAGLPIAPGHNLLFGHLLYFKYYIDKLPPKAHYFNAFRDIYLEHFQDEGVFYLDLWPATDLMLIVISPAAATEAFQTNPLTSMKKPNMLADFFKPIAGGPNLFDMPEEDWRPWRIIFNKGFNEQHLITLVPGMVKQTMIFRESLTSFAREKKIVQLDPVTLRFMLDMIGQTILNVNLGAQRGYNVLADSMLNQIKWHAPAMSFLPNPVRSCIEWLNGRRMDRYIGEQLDSRFSESKADLSETQSKVVIDLVLQAYLKVRRSQSEKLDPGFRAFAIRQTRLFLFAGHDSTSSTICFCIYFLANNPKALKTLRAEHDLVFGKDWTSSSQLLLESPHLANELPYTSAVIKEAMRLFPAASGIRAGSAGVSIVDEVGNSCPTDEHTSIYSIHQITHVAPKYWPRPNDFLPERWLVEPGHELYPPKGAWRPFEQGPRNCIAQGLVLLELRVVLASIVREFDFKDAYDEWDVANPKAGEKTYRGARAYLIEEGASHMVDHFPCRISLRSQ